MSIIIYDAAIKEIDISDYLEEVGGEVATSAQSFSNVPAGNYPNTSGHPWQRSGQLHSNMESVLSSDENGMFVDVGTDAISPRQSYPYGYYLEASGRFTFLTAALEALDIPFSRV